MSTSSNLKSWWRPPSVWTFWDVFWVRCGGTCIGFGILAHVLPLFGLQLRKLNSLGSSAAAAAGTTIAVIGLAMIVYVLLLKGRVLKGLLIVAALMVIAFVGLLIIGWFSSRRMVTPPLGPPPFTTAPGSFPSGAPAGPGYTPPSAAGRTGLSPPPAMDYDSLIARFGKDRVVRITITDVEGIDLGGTVRKRIDAMDASIRPGSWRVTFSGGRGNLIAAPVGDLAAFIDALRLGEVVGVDQTERSAEIRLDRNNAVRKPGTP